LCYKNILAPDLRSSSRRIFADIRKLERLETENKLIIDVNPLTPSGNRTIPPRFNNTTIAERRNTKNAFVFQARILPQSEPYCHASFLIEIEFLEEYPFKAPKITLLDPIYHPRVRESGTLCYGCDRCNGIMYVPTKYLVDIIEYVIYLIDNISDSFCVANRECFTEYMEDHPTFYRKALERTISYGRPRY
jgi:ubiquitin-protein ligase